MEKFVIKQGEHYSSPRTFKLFKKVNNKKFSWLLLINKDLVYNLNDEDQYDWSKLCGISLFDFIPNDKNSIRVGYRYNPEQDRLELNCYMHFRGKTEMTQPLLLIEPTTNGTIVRVEIEIFEDIWKMTLTDIDNRQVGKFEKRMPKGEARHFSFGYENGFYFGGNKAAPKELSLLKKCV